MSLRADHLWVSIEHSRTHLNANSVCVNAFEWVWTPPECDWVHMNAFEWVWTSPPCNWVHVNMIECAWTPPEFNWVHVNVFEWVWTPHECDWVRVNTFKWGLSALEIHRMHFWLLFMIAIVYYLWLLFTIIMVPCGLNMTFLEQCFNWWVWEWIIIIKYHNITYIAGYSVIPDIY